MLSHRSAASLWGLVGDWQRPFEVTTNSDRRRKGISIHLSTTLLPRDVTTQLGVRTTTIARTIFDRAPGLNDSELQRIVDDGLHRPQLRIEQLHDLIDRLPHSAAAPRLYVLLTPGYRPTRSELERYYRTWCVDHDVPVGIINYRRGEVEIDVYYPEARLIVELDSIAYHADPRRFQSDRRRDRQHLRDGIATVRLTWEALHLDPAGEAVLLLDILAQRRLAA